MHPWYFLAFATALASCVKELRASDFAELVSSKQGRHVRNILHWFRFCFSRNSNSSFLMRFNGFRNTKFLPFLFSNVHAARLSRLTREDHPRRSSAPAASRCASRIIRLEVRLPACRLEVRRPARLQDAPLRLPACRLEVRRPDRLQALQLAAGEVSPDAHALAP